MLPRLKHLHNQTENIDVLLHGGSKGFDSEFITKIFNRSAQVGHSVIAFNFPYLDRGDDSSSGEELLDEQEALGQILNYLQPFGYKKIRFIAKSLGRIVLSKYVSKLSSEDTDVEIVIIGYVLGDIDFTGYSGKISVIQGSEDKFGDDTAVKTDLEKQGISCNVIRIEGADHSYRTPGTKENTYVEEAISHIFK